MKITPYLTFNGECAQAIALYEKAFGGTAEVLRYSDAPPSEGYEAPAGTENLVMHATFTAGGGLMYLCDSIEGSAIGGGVSIHVDLHDVAKVQAAFDVLKEGGEVGMEPQATFWCKSFAMLEDKFGVSWMLSVEEVQ